MLMQVAEATAKPRGTPAKHDTDAAKSPGVGQRTIRRLRRWCAVDLSVFRSVVFNYFCVHTMLLYLSYDVPYIYGPVRAVAHGVSPSAASFLVSIIGISSTVGQVHVTQPATLARACRVVSRCGILPVSYTHLTLPTNREV